MILSYLVLPIFLTFFKNILIITHQKKCLELMKNILINAIDRIIRLEISSLRGLKVRITFRAFFISFYFLV
jgi:hypothetical protein